MNEIKINDKEKPKNPYKEHSLIWELYEGDFSEIDTDKIAENLGTTQQSIRSMIYRIKKETGYVVVRQEASKEHKNKYCRAKYNDPSWIGETFNRLTILEAISKKFPSGGQHYVWKVRCECGNEKIVEPSAILTGKVVSCGCYKKEYLESIKCGLNRKEYQREYKREQRIWRKKHHFCTECGKKDAYTIGGRRLCFECAEKNRKHAIQYIKEEKKFDERIKRADRRKNGLCYICGAPVAKKYDNTWDVYERKPGLCEECYFRVTKNLQDGMKKKGRKVLEPFSFSENAIKNYKKLK